MEMTGWRTAMGGDEGSDGARQVRIRHIALAAVNRGRTDWLDSGHAGQSQSRVKSTTGASTYIIYKHTNWLR